ncbi:MAG: DNA gyrase subunit A [Candidatus Micrarchaeales archaeon]|jgi:DNA gyrase subunit A
MTKISIVTLEEELQSCYVDYAMSVIIGRAIPDVRDGLKPVQRRILYTMYNMNNVHSQPTKKSARIVGECMGKFHPHGDIPIYESLVRMAQSFSMNHTLVEGQGNFGSTDGDPPAAMRYTEVKLSRIADEMLKDLDKNTVPFSPNFDNTEKEPDVLPAVLPNLLVNGASGIAVGVATSIPPHNLSEVCDALLYVLDHKEATSEEILEIIKGPDFPTGGIAIMSQNAYNGYKYGRGQLTVRAKTKIDEKKRRIEITQMPYNVNKASFIENVARLSKDKKITGIRDIRDESGRDGVSVVIDLKEDTSPDQVLNQLYKHTQLEITFPLINLAVLGKMLKNFSIAQMLNAFINYRRDVIAKRSTFELEVAKERLHIALGLITAISQISDVIKTIKESKETSEARSNLMSAYSLSEKQANAILEMRLSRLTQLESNSLNKEKSELESRISYHTEILSNPAKVDDIIKEETKELKKKYGRERRTELLYMEQQSEIKDEDLINDDEVSIILTNSGYVKRMGVGSYKDQERGGKGIIAMNLKEGDFVKHMITARNKDFIICVSNKGRIYWLKAYAIPEGSRYSEGKAIVNLLNLKGEKIVNMFNIKNFSKSKIAFLTTKGVVKKVNALLFSKPRTTGVRAISLNEGDELADAIVFTGEPLLIIVTRSGKSIKFEETTIRSTGRSAAGVRGIKLRENDIAKNIIAAGSTGNLLTVSEKGYGKITEIEKYRTQGRSGSGVLNLKVNDKTGPVTKALFINKEKRLLLINSLGVSIMIPIASIRVTGRAASGVRLMKLEPGAKVIDAKIMEEEVLPQNGQNQSQ